MSENIFPEGMKLWEPRQGAPSFIKGSLTVHLDTFAAWAGDRLDGKGYIRLDLKESKGGGLYLSLNNWKPTPRGEEHLTVDEVMPKNNEESESEIPF